MKAARPQVAAWRCASAGNKPIPGAVRRWRGREIDCFWVAGILCPGLLFMSLHLRSRDPHNWLLQCFKSISMEAKLSSF